MVKVCRINEHKNYYDPSEAFDWQLPKWHNNPLLWLQLSGVVVGLASQNGLHLMKHISHNGQDIEIGISTSSVEYFSNCHRDKSFQIQVDYDVGS